MKAITSRSARAARYIYLHILFGLGFVQSMIGAALASDLLSPHAVKELTLINLLLMAGMGYIKANPEPQLPPDGSAP